MKMLIDVTRSLILNNIIIYICLMKIKIYHNLSKFLTLFASYLYPCICISKCQTHFGMLLEDKSVADTTLNIK
jgi:hypothetical protein